MVAKITTPSTIKRALDYNEQKVQEGSAECLFAGNFLYQVNEMNFHQKFSRFHRLIEKNQSKTNSLHVSLNFHPSEDLSKEKLIKIAEIYMNKIGFGEQPFLVYQHFDAGHPHLHVLTTLIQQSGKRINTFNIARDKSEKARKEIEETYGLIKAAGRNKKQKDQIELVKVQRIKYGAAETEKSISNVLSLVIKEYKFTSLSDLNAVLKLYNVTADRCGEQSRTYQNRGLYYRVLDEKGNKVGVPIKASSIYFKPTLNYLEERFKQNEVLRAAYKSKIKTAIDWVLAKKPANISQFVLELQKEKIAAVLPQNKQSFMDGFTFIDHRTNVVFNGSDLGENYSAKAILDRTSKNFDEQQKSEDKPPCNLLLPKESKAAQLLGKKESSGEPRETNQAPDQKQIDNHSMKESLWDLLMNRGKSEQQIPFDFTKEKKERDRLKL